MWLYSNYLPKGISDSIFSAVVYFFFFAVDKHKTFSQDDAVLVKSEELI